MAQIKSLADIVSKWQARAAVAAQDYVAGVTRPGVDWAGPTVAAETSYNTGVQDAISRGAFRSGVESAGNNRWQQRAKELGSQRFAQGVAASGDRFREGFSASHGVIASLQLQPRGPRGSAANLQRVQQIADALRQAKLSRA